MKNTKREKKLSPDERIIQGLFKLCDQENDEAVRLIAEALDIILYRTHSILVNIAIIFGAVSVSFLALLFSKLFF